MDDQDGFPDLGRRGNRGVDLAQTAGRGLMAINRPALRLLCATLRDPSSWPVGFEWDYGLCTNCAIGLASQIGLIPLYGISFSYDLATALGIPDGVSRRIFLRMDDDLGVREADVTPDMVADALEELLASEASR